MQQPTRPPTRVPKLFLLGILTVGLLAVVNLVVTSRIYFHRRDLPLPLSLADGRGLRAAAEGPSTYNHTSDPDGYASVFEGMLVDKQPPPAPGSSTIDIASRGRLGHACQGLDACISIHVFAYRRLDATVSLLEALRSADYSSYHDRQLPLILHLDVPKPTAGGDEKEEAHRVQEYVMSTPLVWPHGPVVVDIKAGHAGLKASWLSAWDDPLPHDVMIAFEDDMMPSPWYFKWLMHVMKEYELLGPTARDKNLLGLSLSPIQLDEITYPFRRWQGSDVIDLSTPLYLHAVPSSWGAIYFGDRWREFSSFVRLRGHPPFYPEEQEEISHSQRGRGTKLGDPNLWIPDSRANCWFRSWKRFMVDFAFGRGAYMLYPNLPGNAGLATSTFLTGEHTHKATNSRPNPRMAPLVKDGDIDFAAPLQGYSTLPVFDLHGQKIDRWGLARQGDDFLQNVASLGSKYEDLTTAWQRSCLLDDAQGLEQPMPILMGRKYLVLAPPLGLDDQFKAIVHGAQWAQALGRTLVLPSLFWPCTSEAVHAVAYSDIFAPGDVSTLLPGFNFIYEDQMVVSEWKASRVIRIEPTTALDSLNRYGWGSLPTVDLPDGRWYLQTRDDVYRNLGSCHDQVMVLDGLHNQPLTPLDKYTELGKELFRSTPMLQLILDGVQANLMTPHQKTKKINYDCLLMRWEDSAAPGRGSAPMSPWLGLLPSTRWNCSVSVPEAVSSIGTSPAQTLLVLSDEPQGESSYRPLSHKRIIGRRDISGFVDQKLARSSPQLRATVSAVVEQRVCANARHVFVHSCNR